ncbi:hypothetical protein HOO68_06210, partial [Candidatus Gracilibacteria bacterium]|nr:hypothetical protein [Candidatus Gracilibacteria bacterium]
MSSADETAQIGSKELIFPDVAENKVIRKRLYLKNTLSSDLSLDFSSLSAAISGTPYSLINNSCLAVLLPNKVCYFDLQMEYSSSLSYAPINFRLYGESTDFGLFSLLGNKQAPVAPNKNIQFTKIGQLSDINSDRSIRIYLKNNGDIVYNSSMTIPAEYQVVRSSCVGTLLSSRSCYVDLKIKDTLDPNIVGVNKSIDYDGSSFAITAGSGSSPES